jgi:dCMP deaminase
MEGLMTWDSYFQKICEAVAANSKCLHRKTGAVLVRENVVICTAYNGPPRGVPHCKPLHTPCKTCAGTGRIDDLVYANNKVLCPICLGEGMMPMCPRIGKGYMDGLSRHLCPAAHAEQNVIAHAARFGIRTKGATVYVNSKVPCKDSLVALINAGVREIVCDGVSALPDYTSGWLIQNSSIYVRKFNDSNGADKD